MILDEHFASAEAIFVADPEYGWMIRCAKNRCGYAGKAGRLILDTQH